MVNVSFFPNTEEYMKTTSIISENTKLKGKLVLKGGLRIDGSLEGELECDADVFLGKTAKVKAPIKAKGIYSSGAIEGNILAPEEIHINRLGKISGNIQTKNILLEEGASFSGHCTIL